MATKTVTTLKASPTPTQIEAMPWTPVYAVYGFNSGASLLDLVQMASFRANHLRALSGCLYGTDGEPGLLETQDSRDLVDLKHLALTLSQEVGFLCARMLDYVPASMEGGAQ